LSTGSERVAWQRARSSLLAVLRAFFAERDFCEVSTPCLARHADPALHLDSFRTSTSLPDGREVELFLPTSPEFFMKRLLVDGLERIYQICPFFRRGELSPRHHPQFTGLEWYQVGMGLEQLMAQTELLVRHCAAGLQENLLLAAGCRKILQAAAFPRLTLRQACRELAGVELPEDFAEAGVRRALAEAGVYHAADDGLDDLVNRVLIERVEPRLNRYPAVFISEYPAAMAALARLDPARPWLAERFELYLGGMEIANGYHELGDARQQRRRFEEQLRLRKSRRLPEVALDEAFLRALEQGLPDCSGCALGVDRLLMFLGGEDRIARVLAFSLEEELGGFSD